VKILILRSVRKSFLKDDYSVTMNTSFAERFISHLSNEEDFCDSCANECAECRKTYNLDFKENIVKILNFPATVPAIIEDVKELLPSEVPLHDILIAIGVNEEIIISFIEEFSDSKGVIIPIEESNWISPNAIMKITKICKDKNIEVSFPKPFCSFNPDKGILYEFKKIFKIGKPEIKFNIKDNIIIDAEVLSSAPCGATYYTVRGLKKKSLKENLGYIIDNRLSCYPCTAGTMVDRDFKDSIIHEAVKIQRDVLV
jgi:hypothetical protein